MNKIVSDNLVKQILGITGTSQDAKVSFFNDLMTKKLADILTIQDFDKHSVVDEPMTIGGDGSVLYPKEFPITTSTITLKDYLLNSITGYTFRNRENTYRTVEVMDSAGTMPSWLPHGDVYISYTAGYTVKDTILLLSLTGLAGKTLTVKDAKEGTITVYTFVAASPVENQILVGVDEDATAVNIAKALGGTSLLHTATLGLDMHIESYDVTANQATITASDLPYDFKLAVALMVEGAIAEVATDSDIQSYSIGGKSVTYTTKSGDTFKDIVNRYVRNYRDITVLT